MKYVKCKIGSCIWLIRDSLATDSLFGAIDKVNNCPLNSVVDWTEDESTAIRKAFSDNDSWRIDKLGIS